MNKTVNNYDFATTPLNNLIRKITAYVVYFSMVLTLLLFLFGTVEDFGRKISVLKAIDFIFNIFSTPKTAIYLYISNLFIGVFYIVCIIVLAKNTFKALSPFCYLLKKEPGEHSFRLATEVLLSLFYGCIRTSVIFCILSCAFGEYQLSSNGVWLLVIAGISYVSICYLMSSLEEFTFIDCIYRTVCSAIFFIVCAFSLKYLLCHSIFNMVNGMKAASSGIYEGLDSVIVLGAIYKTIIFPILFFILEMIFFSIIYFGLSSYCITDGIKNVPIKPFLSLSIIIVLLGIIIKTATSGSSSSDIITYFNYAKENLPILLCSVSILIVSKFESVDNKKESSVQKDNSETVEQQKNDEVNASLN